MWSPGTDAEDLYPVQGGAYHRSAEDSEGYSSDANNIFSTPPSPPSRTLELDSDLFEGVPLEAPMDPIMVACPLTSASPVSPSLPLSLSSSTFASSVSFSSNNHDFKEGTRQDSLSPAFSREEGSMTFPSGANVNGQWRTPRAASPSLDSSVAPPAAATVASVLSAQNEQKPNKYKKRVGDGAQNNEHWPSISVHTRYNGDDHVTSRSRSRSRFSFLSTAYATRQGNQGRSARTSGAAAFSNLMPLSPGPQKRARRNYDQNTKNTLMHWFLHHEGKSPTHEERKRLAEKTNLSRQQISTWMQNARRRYASKLREQKPAEAIKAEP
ncbi:hypothetical protein BCR43DRAFT_495550 [Syncephalastrum racemosum]|uniref:Homeobox domain-containing protein n=1 Tax=Syncephalastrum racemosum TaxID=13706 RepID=A0A1X2H6A1_SYNRA|nr:hypothetical protein BCR43DRAFT_495550 [Syncephalastrum racemosum]